MLKKTITYKDFNDQEVKEDHFFHLSKAELIEMELGHDGGMSGMIKRIIDANDVPSLIREFKDIVLRSYGKKSEDGRRFIKTQEMRDDFATSEAYSELFMDLVTNEASAIEFMNGIVPDGMIPDTEEEPTTEKPEPRVISRKEAQDMDAAELTRGLVAGEYKIEDF